MATSKSTPSTEKSSAQGTVAPEGDPALKKGELTGKVRGRDVDTSFHTYEFTDPQTGEPVEWTPVVHDVAVGVNSDGSVKTEKANEGFAKGEDIEAAAGQGPDLTNAQAQKKASGGEAGETPTGSSTATREGQASKDSKADK